MNSNYAELQNYRLYPELEEQQQPSAPPPETPPEPAYLRINWTQLPATDTPTETSWWSSQKVRSTAGNMLQKTSVPAGGAAVFAALTFTAAPIVVIGTVGTLAAWSFGSYYFGKQLSTIPEDTRLADRLAIKECIEKGSFKYSQIKNSLSKNILTHEELNLILSDDIVNLSYPKFISKHGRYIVDILDDNNLKNLDAAFFNYAANELTLCNLIDFKEYGRLPSEIKTRLFQEILSREIDSCIAREITYGELKSRNTFLAICKFANSYPEWKERLTETFLSLPYDQLTSLSHAEDRLFFSIGEVEIKKTLRTRWEKKPISQLIEKKTGFIESIGKEFQGNEWREKVVIETQQLSIKELAQHYAVLFKCGILTANTLYPDGQTIKQRVEEVLLTIPSTEKLEKALPEVLFDCHIVDKNTPKIAQLVTQYLFMNLQTFISTEDSNKDPSTQFIKRHHLIPNLLDDKLQQLLSRIQESKNHLTTLIAEQHRIRDYKISPFEQKLTYKRSEADKQKSACDLSKQAFILIENKSAQLRTRQAELAKKLASLNLELTELERNYGPFSEKETILAEAKALKATIEQHYTQIPNNPTYAYTNRQISELKQKEQLLLAQKDQAQKIAQIKIALAQLKSEVETLKAEVESSSFLEKKCVLKKTIEEEKETRSQPVMGLVPAVTSLIKQAVGSSKNEQLLASMEKKEELLQQKQQKLAEMNKEIAEQNSTMTLEKIDRELTSCQHSLKGEQNNLKVIERDEKKRLNIQDLEEQLADLKKKGEFFQNHTRIKKESADLTHSIAQVDIEIQQTLQDLSREQMKVLHLQQSYQFAKNDAEMTEQKLNRVKEEAEKACLESINLLKKENEIPIATWQAEFLKEPEFQNR